MAMSDSPLDPGPAVETPPAIQVENLSISYRLRIDNDSTWQDIRQLVTRRGPRQRIVPALRDISFVVPPGRTLAVIGRNGAGKSTLLRALAGILLPEEGRVTIRGRSSLLAIGLGMNPKLTGRQNIRLGGLAHGISPERLEEITDEIAEFAQLDEYIDYPMSAYSTGMRQRLAFSVAANLDPEILLIDEALGGGDAAFSERASEKMASLMGEGRTIVLVTHGLSSVRTMATEAIWVHQGRVEAAGDPEDVVAAYRRYSRLEQIDLEL